MMATKRSAGVCQVCEVLNMSQSQSVTSFRSRPDVAFELPRGVVIPPRPMSTLHAGGLVNRWRYVGVWGPNLSLCATKAQVGPAYQEWWAIWDRHTLTERTRMLPGSVDLRDGQLTVRDGEVSIALTLREIDAFQVLTLDERAYTWTHKHLVHAEGTVCAHGREQQLVAVGLIDDSAGYHPRHTRYRWSAGTGTDTQGRSVAWNLVVGINDLPTNSEQTLWLNGVPQELGPVTIADDLAWVTFSEGGRLDFQAEAVRQKDTNLLLIRSRYRQPFGTFSGTLPGGVALQEAYGVMEYHDVYW
jgi:hypothetical protein